MPSTPACATSRACSNSAGRSRQKSIDRGYVVTKSLDDFGTIDLDAADLPDTATRILRIPAALLCYWMGEAELTPEQASD